MKKLLSMCVICSIIACYGLFTAAQEPAKVQEPAAKPAPAQKAPEMSPEEKAAMDKMIAAGAPGDPHKFIAGMEGVWKASVKVWHAAGQTPQESEGISIHRMIMGGRYLQQSFKSSFMDAPFQGIGFMGYNNVLKQYESFWIDNMSTAMMTSKGTISEDGKTINSVTTYTDPQSGREKKSRDVLRSVDVDKFVSQMYDIGEDGKEFLMMEITYTRQAAPVRPPTKPPLRK